MVWCPFPKREGGSATLRVSAIDCLPLILQWTSLMLRRTFFFLFVIAAPSVAADVVTQKPELQPANTADARPRPDAFNVLPGFQVEKIFTVPKNRFGSWVCLTVD